MWVYPEDIDNSLFASKISFLISIPQTNKNHNKNGSHKQYKHLTKKGVVTIAGKPGEDVPKGTQKNGDVVPAPSGLPVPMDPGIKYLIDFVRYL